MKQLLAVGILACSLLISATSAHASPLYKSKYRYTGAHSHRVVNKVVVTRPAPIRTVTTVSALGLNALPVGYVRFVHDNETFYYSNGVYYQKRAQGFVLVKPRAGFRVASLPNGYRVVREGRSTFYTFNNVRYRKLDGFFVVV